MNIITDRKSYSKVALELLAPDTGIVLAAWVVPYKVAHKLIFSVKSYNVTCGDSINFPLPNCEWDQGVYDDKSYSSGQPHKYNLPIEREKSLNHYTGRNRYEFTVKDEEGFSLNTRTIQITGAHTIKEHTGVVYGNILKPDDLCALSMKVSAGYKNNETNLAEDNWRAANWDQFVLSAGYNNSANIPFNLTTPWGDYTAQGYLGYEDQAIIPASCEVEVDELWDFQNRAGQLIYNTTTGKRTTNPFH